MISKASTHIIIAEATEDLITNEPWSIENYAEGLMDELFTDIDNILDVRRKLPNHTVRKESVSKPTVTMGLPNVVLPRKLDKRLQVMSPLNPKTTNALVVNAPSVTAISPRSEQKSQNKLAKSLLLGVTLLVTMAIALYLLKSRLWNLLIHQLTLPNLSAEKIETPVNTKPDVEADLVNYMLEALTVIEKQEVENQIPVKTGFPDINLKQTNTLALPNTQPTGALPPPPIVNRPTAVPQRGTNVVERIYIPVYQPQQPVHPPITPIPTVPRKIPPLAAANTSIPLFSPEPKKLLVQPRTKLPHLKPSKLQINSQPLRIAPPKLPVATAPITRPTLETPTIVNQPSLSLPRYSAELSGLLELGNKSAALFKIDGVTNHINIGENIGSSGWTLVEVSKGEAVIRRNGEVRSIYPGQKL